MCGLSLDDSVCCGEFCVLDDFTLGKITCDFLIMSSVPSLPLLGHGNVHRYKVPTKVEVIGSVKQVACGEAHTLALSTDGKTVWSFGSGDLGRLGHGDSSKQLKPKVQCTGGPHLVSCLFGSPLWW